MATAFSHEAESRPRPADIGVKALVSGCSGLRLTAAEIDFFSAEQPLGLILFARNCRQPEQVSDLCAEFRVAVGRPDAPILIDQEGGRVQRLRPPYWDGYPSASVLGHLHDADDDAGRRAAYLHGRLIASDLNAVGIDINCAPVLDVLGPEANDAIGTRSFGSQPDDVATLGACVAEGLGDGGVVPVVKHMPGQGRAAADSHIALPVVDAPLSELDQTDFAPFVAVPGIRIGMTGHVVFRAVDRTNPATVSAAVIGDIIRGRIGFDGLLLSDDVSMDALSGDYPQRAAAIYAAGCDLVLHCNGGAEEMRAIADAAPVLSGKSKERASLALKARRRPAAFDRHAARAEYRQLLARVGWPAAG